MIDEPRTSVDIIRDLADLLRDRQWSGQYNTSCHCHPEYSPCCAECGAPEYGTRKVRVRGNDHTIMKAGEHAEDCHLHALLVEAEECIAAEEARCEPENAREHSGKTSWDHVLEAS